VPPTGREYFDHTELSLYKSPLAAPTGRYANGSVKQLQAAGIAPEKIVLGVASTAAALPMCGLLDANTKLDGPVWLEVRP
jgi:hypothetical protein